MELSDLTIRPGPLNTVEAELRADVVVGDRGYTLSITGWGETEAVARGQVDAALAALGLDVEKIRAAI